jgi:serine/threonine protein kinase
LINWTSSPAEQLNGLTLDGGWTVGQRITPSAGTGGAFSAHYQVTSADGESAFLKALDIKSLFNSPNVDFAEKMKELGTLFTFEREMLRKCENMSRVVTALAYGQAVVPNMQFGIVPYFIFKMASGDVRAQLAVLGPQADASWKLNTLHQIAIGLSQMHRLFLAHQDVKPSNVLVYADGSRISDLGRASERGVVCPHDAHPTAGDPMYSPPEVYYGYVPADWTVRRFGADIYLLGSMVVYLFSQLSMNALLYQHLDARFYANMWSGGYDAVLPYLQDAFAKALDQFEAQVGDPGLAADLRIVVSQLCNPDVGVRGNPRSNRRARSPYSLEQYISRFNLLARRAEYRRSA